MLKITTLLAVIIPIIFLPLVILGVSENQSVQYGSADILAAKDEPLLAKEPAGTLSVTSVEASAEVIDVLENEFCSTQICGNGNWQQWIIVSPEHPWEAEELKVVSRILSSVIVSLEGQELDGRTLLNGYRFRRQHGEYINGHDGRIAVVNHNEQVITLADAAFKRLHGFYIIHELGHIIDFRSGRQLSAAFHTLAGSDNINNKTAPGFWLNLNAEGDLEEATADAFALWIMAAHEADYKPVFAYTPLTANYRQIEASIAAALGSVSTAQAVP